VEEIKKEVGNIVKAADPNEIKSIFECEHKCDDSYFLDSGDKVRYFLEKNAFDKQGNLIHPIKDSLNKIGHGMHDVNKTFEKFSYSKEMKYIAKMLGFQKPMLVQSMYIFKNAKVGGEVNEHTDNSYLRTTPQSCIGIWVALDDATKENGGMWGYPGSHRVPTNYFMKIKKRCKWEDLLIL